ncbi:serine/threonine-protein kinase PknK [Nannocystaceae bacterium ST9]
MRARPEPQFAGTDRLELRGRIGQGGMGVVFRVFDRELGREVALKTLLRPGPEQLYRVKREFRSRAGLSHPNLLDLHDLFVEGDQCFFTMELLAAADFMTWVRGTGYTDRTVGTGEVPIGLDDEDEETSTMSSAQSAALFTDLDSGLPSRDPDGSLHTGLNSGVGRSVGPLIRARKPEPIDAEGEARLRPALIQLVRGLRALHEFGTVHRDVKPANVLVTQTGRVVLLDFGVALERDDEPEPGESGRGKRGEIVGTVAYMAPEQSLGEEVSGAADLYAVGVMLYQALTGTVPFTGRIADVFRSKVELSPTPPQLITPGVPEDLARLAMELLAIDPEARPSASEVLARLEGHADAGSASDSLTNAAIPAKAGRRTSAALGFIGRARELAELERGHRRVVDEGRAIQVHVHGLSGIGKSMLLRKFLAPLRGRAETLVLRSRCDPQESVAYNAFDAAIDALARRLANLAREVADELVPEHAHALIRVFPVLGRVVALAEAVKPKLEPDAFELRRQAFEALRELLGRLARRETVVIWLDDLHWGDRDSIPLFDMLAGPGLEGEPPPACLWLLGYRDEGAETSPLLAHLRQAREQPDAIDLPLRPLAAAEIEALAEQVFTARQAEIDQAQRGAVVRAIVEQSGGNPFIVHEFARFLAEGGLGNSGQTELDWVGIVRSRLEQLEPAERTLLELLAVAGRPIERDRVLQASGLGTGARTRLAGLREAALLRSISSDHLAGSGSSGVSLALYHDRVRQAVLQGLDANTRPERHRALAETLESAGSDDFETLAHHFAAAGLEFRERALDYSIRAADRAATSLAFDRASELYAHALGLLEGLPARAGERIKLLRKFGDAQANIGRLPEAAARYLEAATLLGAAARPGHKGGRPTDDAEVRELSLRAGELYIKAGLLGEGWRVMRELLAAFDVKVPTSPIQAMIGANWRRARFVLRKLDVDKPATPSSPEALIRLELLWTVSTSLSMVNHTLSDAFRTMVLAEFDKLGPSARCRALAIEVAMETHVGGPFERSSKRLLEQCEVLSKRTKNRYDEAWRLLGVATVEFTHGRWRACAQACEQADTIFRDECTGAAWERSTVAVYHWFALAWLGDLAELHARLDDFIADAEAREDVFGLVEAYTGQVVLAWLAADQVDLARERAEAGMARATAQSSQGERRWPEHSYRRQHYCDLMASTHVALYRGDPCAAWQALLGQWKDMQSAFFITLRTVGLEIRFARARLALAMIELFARDPELARAKLFALDRRLADEWNQTKLFADLRQQLEVFRKDANRFAQPMADLLEAGVAALEGRRDAAIKLLDGAVRGFDAVDMALHRACARYALGELLGGSEGADMQALAIEWMRGQGVVEPRKLAASQALGFGLG